MAMDEMKIQRIHDILLGDMRPWHKDNATKTRQYWDASISQEIKATMDKFGYELKVDEWLFFTSRLRFYRREVDNSINRHLSYVTETIDKNQNSFLVSYMLKNTKNWVVSYIHTANKELDNLGVTDNDVIGEDVNFNVRREEKEFFILLRYIIVSLAKCYLELQSRYQHLMGDRRLYDISSFYMEFVGRRVCKLFPLILKSKPSVNVVPNCCFKYQSDSFNDDISTLHETLLDYGWIDSNTTLAMLIDLFSGKGCMHSIMWLVSPGILQEIIKPWIKKKVISVYPNGVGHWSVVSLRFVDKNKNPMKELGNEDTRQKKNRQKIDDVVKILM